MYPCQRLWKGGNVPGRFQEREVENMLVGELASFPMDAGVSVQTPPAKNFIAPNIV